MTTEERLDRIIQSGLTGFLIFGAIAAFFSTSLIPYSDARSLYNVGGAFGSGAACVYIAANLPRPFRKVPFFFAVLMAIALLVYGAYQFSFIESDAKANFMANEQRCIVIQKDMLSAYPRRTDGPDLFQALGCHPKGAGKVYASPRSVEGMSR